MVAGSDDWYDGNAQISSISITSYGKIFSAVQYGPLACNFSDKWNFHVAQLGLAYLWGQVGQNAPGFRGFWKGSSLASLSLTLGEGWQDDRQDGTLWASERFSREAAWLGPPEIWRQGGRGG